jgi:Mg-chelatase subunit ChlD
MMGGGSTRAALAAAAIALALGACGGGDSGDDASAAPIERGNRDPANFLIVLDASEPMADDDRLDKAREALGSFVRELPDGDSVGLAAYSDRFRPLVPISPVPGVRARIADALTGLEAGGGAALHDAVMEAYGIQRELAGENRIDGVLVIAHAPDSGSESSVARVEKLLGARAGSATRVPVITVSYGDGPADELAALARASGGKAYESGGDDLEAVLRKAWNGL